MASVKKSLDTPSPNRLAWNSLPWIASSLPQPPTHIQQKPLSCSQNRVQDRYCATYGKVLGGTDRIDKHSVKEEQGYK